MGGVACCSANRAEGERVDIPRIRWAKTIDGASIAYQDYGEGDPCLVVVPGGITHLEVGWEQPHHAAFLRRFARNMRVLHFDKRGLRMSDRLAAAPPLDVQMDDVRAVMDAAGVERAVLASGGSEAPALAAFFAATNPARVQALWLDGFIHSAPDADFPAGDEDEAEWQAWLSDLPSTWGRDDIDRLAAVRMEFGEFPDDAPYDDPQFLHWFAKLERNSATPTSYVQFLEMWRATDVRPVLPTISAPTAVAVHEGRGPADTEQAYYTAARIPGARLVSVPRPWMPAPADAERHVAALERFIDSVRDEEAALDRMLATVLFTDIVGSTDKACAVGDACWKELLERHDQVTRALLARYRGSEVKTTGDGFLATFDGPARAVRCARGICEAVRPLGIEVRAGCHTGEIELMGADVGGVGVHIGARVAALAGPSEVLVSSTVKDLVAGSGLQFAERGQHELKGVPGTWRLYVAE
jgi:class 3 adenylate cyclase